MYPKGVIAMGCRAWAVESLVVVADNIKFQQGNDQESIFFWALVVTATLCQGPLMLGGEASILQNLSQNLDKNKPNQTKRKVAEEEGK